MKMKTWSIHRTKILQISTPHGDLGRRQWWRRQHSTTRTHCDSATNMKQRITRTTYPTIWRTISWETHYMRRTTNLYMNRTRKATWTSETLPTRHKWPPTSITARSSTPWLSSRPPSNTTSEDLLSIYSNAIRFLSLVDRDYPNTPTPS